MNRLNFAFINQRCGTIYPDEYRFLSSLSLKGVQRRAQGEVMGGTPIEKRGEGVLRERSNEKVGRRELSGRRGVGYK